VYAEFTVTVAGILSRLMLPVAATLIVKVFVSPCFAVVGAPVAVMATPAAHAGAEKATVASTAKKSNKPVFFLTLSFVIMISLALVSRE